LRRPLEVGRHQVPGGHDEAADGHRRADEAQTEGERKAMH
jgi:hypothetical protein